MSYRMFWSHLILIQQLEPPLLVLDRDSLYKLCNIKTAKDNVSKLETSVNDVSSSSFYASSR
jgi:hypothetical protein